MNRQEVFEHCREKYKTEPDYPWKDQNAVLRHEDNGKWYGFVMEVKRDKIGIDGSGKVDILNLKCDPMLIGCLRMKSGFLLAYRMNKNLWISIVLEGLENDGMIKSLIDWSYQVTAARKKRMEID